jgi:hypothetical protein
MFSRTFRPRITIMSRLNKVNKGNYDQAGRLTPDELGRERMNQAQVRTRAKPRKRVRTSTRRRTARRKPE